MDLKNTNITLIGDSISKGLYLQKLKPVPLEQSALKIIENKYDIKINCQSCFGQTLQRACDKKVFENYLSTIDTNQNNLLILWLGGNDADFNWKEVAAAPQENHQPKTPINEFEEYLNNTLKMLTNANVKVVLLSLPPIDSERYFEVIGQIADKEKVLQFFNNDISVIYRYQERYSRAIVQAAKNNNCSLIDIRNEFLLRRDLRSLLASDGIHPNQQGQQLIASFIKKKIEE